MKNIFKLVLTGAIALTMTLGLVHAQGQVSPEEQEYVYRDSLFRVISYKAYRLPAAKAAGDQAAFQEAAAEIAYLSEMITDGFQIQGNIPENSLALPSIWEDFEDFGEKAMVLRDAAQALADSGDMDDYDPRQFGGTNCGGCHRDYKQRAN